MGSLVLFHGLAFHFNVRAHEFTRRWKTTGSHQSEEKNKSAQSAGPTFSQHFPTQASPHYIQLDPIYYVCSSFFCTRTITWAVSIVTSTSDMFLCIYVYFGWTPSLFRILLYTIFYTNQFNAAIVSFIKKHKWKLAIFNLVTLCFFNCTFCKEKI